MSEKAIGTFMIREDGKNGELEVYPNRLVRIIKKRIGKDDTQTIPLRAIDGIHHDLKTLRTNEVVLLVGATKYEWKVKKADKLVDAVNEVLLASV